VRESFQQETHRRKHETLEHVAALARELKTVESIGQHAQQKLNEIGDRCESIVRTRASCEERAAGTSMQPSGPRPDLSSYSPSASFTDNVILTVFGPRLIVPSTDFTLDVWAYLPEFKAEIQASLADDMQPLKDKYPVPIERGTVLQMMLALPGFEVKDREDSALWTGSRSSASFPVHAPQGILAGSHGGTVKVYVNGLQAAKIHFVVTVGTEAASQTQGAELLESRTSLPRSAFASYASRDRDAVLGRIQGMQKIIPYLDIFLDVHSLRSGERWRERITEEIARRDVLYLFWSTNAQASEHVDWEWREALKLKGHDGIEPVPLENPVTVKPPPELSDLHFNDWTLAYHRSATR
jgi:hypothetical protein